MPPCDPAGWGACFGAPDAPVFRLSRCYRSALPIARLCESLLPGEANLNPIGREGEPAVVAEYSDALLRRTLERFRKEGYLSLIHIYGQAGLRIPPFLDAGDCGGGVLAVDAVVLALAEQADGDEHLLHGANRLGVGLRIDARGALLGLVHRADDAGEHVEDVVLGQRRIVPVEGYGGESVGIEVGIAGAVLKEV